MFCLWPEPVCRAIAESPRATCTLVGTCLADIDRGEARHASARVEPRCASNARVNNYTYAIDSE